MKTVLQILAVLALTGCATNYDQYASAQVKIAEAQAITAKYKYEALALMGNSGGDAAKVAAIMSINQQSSQQQQALQAPKSWQDQALQWASVLVPSLTQMYSINANKATQLAQIEASTKAQMHQADTYVQFGTLINDPTVVTQPTPLVVNPVVVNPAIVGAQVSTSNTNTVNSSTSNTTPSIGLVK